MMPIYMHTYLENNLYVQKGEEIWNILISDTPSQANDLFSNNCVNDEEVQNI